MAWFTQHRDKESTVKVSTDYAKKGEPRTDFTFYDRNAGDNKRHPHLAISESGNVVYSRDCSTSDSGKDSGGSSSDGSSSGSSDGGGGSSK